MLHFTLIFSIVFLIIYLYFKFVVFSYWKYRSIEYLEPEFPLGNFGNLIKLKESLACILHRLHRTTDKPFIGTYFGFVPILLVRDPSLIRSICTTDFQYFPDRGTHVNAENDPISGHLFALKGEKWRELRLKFTPIFTTGKLKAIFPSILECGIKLEKFIDKLITSKGSPVEVKEFCCRYTTDSIASIVFGLQINCLDEPNCEFREIGRRLLEPNLVNGLYHIIFFLYPKLIKLLRIRAIEKRVENFMVSIVKENMEYRMKNKIVRKDLFHLLMELHNYGSIDESDENAEWKPHEQIDDGSNKTTTTTNKKPFTIIQIAAQALMFYVAGFETSASTISFTLYELARNPDIQQRLRDEIEQVLAQHNGEITYEAVSEMKFLDACISESLRMYPPAPLLNRECLMPYKLPGTDKVLEKGTKIIISIVGVQRDGKYFPDPDTYKPDRFMPEQAKGKTFQQLPFLAFGDGPRYCIGLRIGRYQAMLAIILLVRKFSIELNEKMEKPNAMKIDPRHFALIVKDGIHLNFTRR